MLPKIQVLGVGVSSGTEQEIAKAVADVARARARATLCALNVHTWSENRRNPACAEAFREAEIAWPDGVPIVWAARWSGTPIGPRIHGHDLMRLLFRQPLSHFFYGSTPDVLKDLERKVRSEFPGIRIVGMRSPAFTKRARPIPDEDAASIRDSKADILWVALGAPKQELWMHLNRERIDVPVMAGVGAAFEILAGRFSRAPRVLQRMGMEWLWRLAQDPARLWRRYFSTNGLFLATLLGRLLSPSRPRSS
ncbi:MAG: WecB/TagA/CpsF family glycosyltransferase [Acidobacteria bacterium]|nr:WecB/TagA/CpsF family glycosyltransferase [Acidobacteriota bacterium]